MSDWTQPTKGAARSALPFAVELWLGLQVDGTLNVPTTFATGIYPAMRTGRRCGNCNPIRCHTTIQP
jgi:hypothetical protein